ncbi:MAG TPA: hypothetical protein VMB34_04455 [Acetobacteraceae bacterium]|nr:hypothetical protein [Acetobacteraceae bacterium]
MMLLLLLGALAIPTRSAIQQQRQAAQIVATARAGQEVFTALQYLRPERGAVQAALGAPNPAEPAFVADMEKLRGNAAVAIEAVLHDCMALRCGRSSA